MLFSHSVVSISVTPRTAACQASQSSISQSLFKLMSIESVMASNHLVLCFPLLLLPSIFPNIQVFSNESALLIRWPNIGALASAPVLPMNNYSWLISFRIDWFDLLAVQETCLWVSWSLRWKHGLTVACCRVRDTFTTVLGACWHKSFWRGSPLLPLALP